MSAKSRAERAFRKDCEQITVEADASDIARSIVATLRHTGGRFRSMKAYMSYALNKQIQEDLPHVQAAMFRAGQRVLAQADAVPKPPTQDVPSPPTSGSPDLQSIVFPWRS